MDRCACPGGGGRANSTVRCHPPHGSPRRRIHRLGNGHHGSPRLRAKHNRVGARAPSRSGNLSRLHRVAGPPAASCSFRAGWAASSCIKCGWTSSAPLWSSARALIHCTMPRQSNTCLSRSRRLRWRRPTQAVLSASITKGAERFEVALTRDQFAQAAQPIYRAIVSLLHQLRPAGVPVAIVMPQLAAQLPGLREQLEQFVGCELVAIPDGFAAAATSLLELPPHLRTRTPSSCYGVSHSSLAVAANGWREPALSRYVTGPAPHNRPCALARAVGRPRLSTTT